ncbi:MAG TPA: hypothetical protein VHZ73_05160 [Vicinamibacterales bacterium]|nr:hypothetical protein [Vicinamibacterales bacterium]
MPQTLEIREPALVNGRVVGSHPVFFGTRGQDGKPYAPYGPLAAVLAVPHHLLGRMVAAIADVPRTPLPGGIVWLIVVGGVTMLSTATAAALAVAGFHRAALALGTERRQALVLSLLLGGATVLWTYGVSLFSEAFQAAAFIWAAALLVESRRQLRGAGGKVALAATLIAIAGLTKVTSLVFAPAFVIAALVEPSIGMRRRVKAAAVLAAGIAIATGIHLAWNGYRFGDLFNFGYDWSETVAQLPARAFMVGDIPRGLAVLLLAPGKSIVLWAPPLLLAAWNAPRFIRREPAVSLGALVAIVVGLLFFAAYQFPEGGYAHGPRNLVPIIPLVLLVAAGPGAGKWPRALVYATAVLGFTVALLSTSVSYLEDQSLVAAPSAVLRTVYYERIDAPAGRPWNRYRLDYIPFAQTIMSPGWLTAPTLGLGPDYFPLHLLQARRQLPRGSAIPLWLVIGWPLAWVILVIATIRNLVTRLR